MKIKINLQLTIHDILVLLLALLHQDFWVQILIFLVLV